MKPNIVLYTDGACKGNPGPGGWGVLALDYLGDEKEFYGSDSNTTNNKMELLAAIKGLEYVRDHVDYSKINKVILYTDSSYVKNGITQWVTKWMHNGWKTAAGKPVKNKNLWISLQSLNKKLEVEWRWVKGHSNNSGNQRADYLANLGAQEVE